MHLKPTGNEHVEHAGTLCRPILEIVRDPGGNPDERASLDIDVLVTDEERHRSIDGIEELLIGLVRTRARAAEPPWQRRYNSAV